MLNPRGFRRLCTTLAAFFGHRSALRGFAFLCCGGRTIPSIGGTRCRSRGIRRRSAAAHRRHHRASLRERQMAPAKLAAIECTSSGGWCAACHRRLPIMRPAPPMGYQSPEAPHARAFPTLTPRSRFSTPFPESDWLPLLIVHRRVPVWWRVAAMRSCRCWGSGPWRRRDLSAQRNFLLASASVARWARRDEAMGGHRGVLRRVDV